VEFFLRTSIPGEIERAKEFIRKDQLKNAINILDKLAKKEGKSN